MTQQELKDLIARAAAEGWTELNLSNSELTEIPPEIGQLTNLTKLNLNYNQLTALPPEIGQLINLTELYLSNSFSSNTELYLSNSFSSNIGYDWLNDLE